MTALQIVELILSITASVLGIIAFIISKQNQSEIKNLKQEINGNHIENSNVNQAAGNMTFKQK